MVVEENAEKDTISTQLFVEKAQKMSKQRKTQELHPGDLQLKLDNERICISPVREDVPFFCVAVHDRVGWHERFVPVSKVLSLVSRLNGGQGWLDFLRDTIYRIPGYQCRRDAQLFVRLLHLAGYP